MVHLVLRAMRCPRALHDLLDMRCALLGREVQASAHLLVLAPALVPLVLAPASCSPPPPPTSMRTSTSTHSLDNDDNGSVSDDNDVATTASLACVQAGMDVVCERSALVLLRR